jgi:hypothetical protein
MTQHSPAGSLLRWGAVIAGAVIGVATMAVLTSLFVALGSDIDAIARNLHWYDFGSAVVALFVGGLLAGGLSRMRGMGSGLLHGLTAWGAILVAALAFPFPLAFGTLLQVFVSPVPDATTGPLWAAFLSLVVGAVAAAIGGIIGGMLTRPAAPERGYERDRELEAGRDYEAGREFEAGRRYEAGRGPDGGRDVPPGRVPNGGRRYEPERGYNGGRTEPAIPTEQQPAGEESPRGRRRR